MNSMNYKNALNRIISYKVYSKSFESDTISEIFQLYKLNPEIIRDDLAKLYEYHLNDYNDSRLIEWDLCENTIHNMESETIQKICDSLQIESYDPDDTENLADRLSLAVREYNHAKECILTGLFDDVPFIFRDSSEDDDCYQQDDTCILADTEEYLAYFELMGEKDPVHGRSMIATTIRNKKYTSDFKPIVLENLYGIEQAILHGWSIKFSYKPVGIKHSTDVVIKPAKIGFDATDNRYVVISAKHQKIEIHDLEYIANIKVSHNTNTEGPTIDISTIPYDKVWGFEYNECFDRDGNIKEPMHVRIKFYNEANVINKVHRDLEHRHPLLLKEDHEGNLLYEDSVYGKEGFLRWIYSYGSSVKILAPDALADEYIAQLKDYLLHS